MDRVAVSYMNMPRFILRIIFILFIALILSFLVFQANSGAFDAEDEKQVAAFGVEENAQALRNRLTAEGKNAYLRKKEVGGKTIYAVIVRESGDASAAAVVPDEEQVGVFGVEENAQALRNELAAEGKFAYLRKKEVNGKTLYAVIVRVSEESLSPPEAMPEATVEESAEARAEARAEAMADAMAEAAAALGEDPMETEAVVEEVAAPVEEPMETEVVVEEVAAPVEPMEPEVVVEEVAVPVEEPMEAEAVVEEVAVPVEPVMMEALSHEMPETPEPMEPEPEPEPVEATEPPAPMQSVGPDVIPIRGLGVSFEISFPTYARIYEGPSFKSRRLGFREDMGMLDVLGDSPEGWLVVRSVNTGRTRYVPADDAKYYKLDRKGRRKGQLPARPQVK